MRERLIGFIAEGTLEGVGIGATEAEVREALGEPEAVSAIRSQIWKYEELEVSFHAGRVLLLTLNAREFGIKLPEFERLLDERSIPHEIDPGLTFDTQTAIAAGAGATIVFDHDGTLDSVSIT